MTSAAAQTVCPVPAAGLPVADFGGPILQSCRPTDSPSLACQRLLLWYEGRAGCSREAEKADRRGSGLWALRWSGGWRGLCGCHSYRPENSGFHCWRVADAEQMARLPPSVDPRILASGRGSGRGRRGHGACRPVPVPSVSLRATVRLCLAAAVECQSAVSGSACRRVSWARAGCHRSSAGAQPPACSIRRHRIAPVVPPAQLTAHSPANNTTVDSPSSLPLLPMAPSD